MELTQKLNLEELVSCHNIAELLPDEDLEKIGRLVVDGYTTDLQSRDQWEKRNEMALKLALQVAEAKSFPWMNASNVKFPLITIAALQYHARSYPTLIQGDDIVRCRTYGDDTEGIRKARADRVENHMNFQILEQDVDWESETDKVLITQPIIGCAFKKSYFDPIKKHNISENVFAKDLVVNYWTKSLDTAPRITQVHFFTKNDLYERVARGLWLELKQKQTNALQETRLRSVKDKSQGTVAPESVDDTTPYEILEQHCYIDFDHDGYAEPYIAYVHKDSRQVLRIVSRFVSTNIEYDEENTDKVLRITPETYFTKFPFIPSPDGGFYDLGFGILLGPLNESINTLINQLIDAGTMSNTAGGFLSRGIKLRGGQTTFAPLEWKHVDTTGDDLKKGIFPLPVREPSQVLFTLLSLLINYGERIGFAVDILTGQNPGQNTPAETSRTMAEQGLKIFNGIFKRTYRALRDEFRKLYRLNQLYLDDKVEYVSDAIGSGVVHWDDYKGSVTDVRPTADPNVVSDSQRMQQAMAVADRAMKVPGYNRYEVEKKFLHAIKIEEVDLLFPDPKGPNAVPPPPNPKVQVEQIKAEVRKADGELKFKLGLMKLMKEAEESQAKIHKLEAEAVVLMKEAESAARNHQMNEINTMIALARERREGVLGSIEMMTKVFEATKPEEPNLEPKVPK